MDSLPALMSAHLPLGFIDGLGGMEMLLIFAVALLLFGGDKLPEFARGLGKVMREVKKAASGVEDEFRRAMDEDERKRLLAALDRLVFSDMDRLHIALDLRRHARDVGAQLRVVGRDVEPAIGEPVEGEPASAHKRHDSDSKQHLLANAAAGCRRSRRCIRGLRRGGRSLWRRRRFGFDLDRFERHFASCIVPGSRATAKYNVIDVTFGLKCSGDNASIKTSQLRLSLSLCRNQIPAPQTSRPSNPKPAGPSFAAPHF